MTDHRALLQRAGEHDGHEDAVLFLFAGVTDSESVVRISDGIVAGDQTILESLPLPSQRYPYPPTGVAIGELARDQDSPYSWYEELCDAYDVAYNDSVARHIHKVATAIRLGLL